MVVGETIAVVGRRDWYMAGESFDESLVSSFAILCFFLLAVEKMAVCF